MASPAWRRHLSFQYQVLLSGPRYNWQLVTVKKGFLYEAQHDIVCVCEHTYINLYIYIYKEMVFKKGVNTIIQNKLKEKNRGNNQDGKLKSKRSTIIV